MPRGKSQQLQKQLLHAKSVLVEANTKSRVNIAERSGRDFQSGASNKKACSPRTVLVLGKAADSQKTWSSSDQSWKSAQDKDGDVGRNVEPYRQLALS